MKLFENTSYHQVKNGTIKYTNLKTMKKLLLKQTLGK